MNGERFQVSGEKSWPATVRPRHFALFRRPVLVVVGVAALVGCAPQRLYRGDVHTHTTFSDGATSIDELLTRARDVARLDFVIVTDHDFGDGAPWRLSGETWAAIQDACERYTVDGVFVPIAGYEWTSQPGYWAEFAGPEPSERLFAGAPKRFNHKNAYFPGRVADIFRAKDEAFWTPDPLAAAVRAAGGLIYNNHPTAGDEGCDPWGYAPASADVIQNTEIAADALQFHGRRCELNTERTVREFLDRGGRTGFVGGSDTHDGRPVARTAVFAARLTRRGIFDALRQRRNYAVFGARIELDSRIDGRPMGAEIEVRGPRRVQVRVAGTDRLAEVAVIRDGRLLRSESADRPRANLDFVDASFPGESYYYVRVTQADADADGNPSRAWSSPIWVRRRG